MTSKRTLNNWRREALIKIANIRHLPKEGLSNELIQSELDNLKILQLTQDLIDHYLMEDKK